MTVSVKSLQKQLIAAIAMVLVAMIALGSSTYAWFAANTKVEATGMSVTAKSDVTFLQIENADGASTNEAKTIATAKNTSATIYPAEYTGAANGADTWKYGYSNNINSSTLDTTQGTSGYFDVQSGSEGNYRLANTYKIYTKATQEGSSKAKNLKVTSCKVVGTGDFLDAVNVVVVCGTKVQTISCAGKTSGNPFDITSAVILDDEVTEKTAGTTDVNVYVYFDGNNENIKTANAISANLVAMQVELTFTCDNNA